MFRSAFVVVFAFVLLQCALSGGARAQVGSNCFGYVSCDYYGNGGTPLPNSPCEPTLPATAFNCMYFLYEPTFGPTCYVMTPWCAPPPEKPCNCTAGSPISLADGDTSIEETDVRLPGLGGGLTLSRRWNSIWPVTESAYQIGLFGPNWRSTYEERVFVGSDHYLKYARGDGGFWSFGYDAGVYRVAAPANVAATLVQGSSNWTLTFQNGEQRVFDVASGHLTAIIDRNGNTTQLSYDSLGRLTTVTDPASRHLYFNYGTGSNAQVTSVTSDFGVTASYSYDTQARLSQVTEPDGSAFTFQYDSNSFISSVLDSQNKVLESHTYDSSGRGLTSSRANGVDAVTLSYQ